MEWQFDIIHKTNLALLRMKQQTLLERIFVLLGRDL